MSALAVVAENTGAVVFGAHHHGKDVTRGAAGSYALTAAADFVLSVFAELENDGVVSGRRVSLTKLRDGPTGWSCEFGLHPVKIGVDDEGMAIVSAFVDPKPTTAGFNGSGQTKEASPRIPGRLEHRERGRLGLFRLSMSGRHLPGTIDPRGMAGRTVTANDRPLKGH